MNEIDLATHPLPPLPQAPAGDSFAAFVLQVEARRDSIELERREAEMERRVTYEAERREAGALVQRLTGQLDQVSSELGGLTTEVGKLSRAQQNMNRDLRLLAGQFESLRKDFDAIHGRVSHHADELFEFRRQLQEIQSAVQGLHCQRCVAPTEPPPAA